MSKRIGNQNGHCILDAPWINPGELVGPIDWNYDFAAHGWDREGAYNPELIPEWIDRLRTLETGIGAGEAWEATTDGGWPRVGWGRVLDIGMYDGWPYWRPVPSILIYGLLSAEWISFSGISDIRKMTEDDE